MTVTDPSSALTKKPISSADEIIHYQIKQILKSKIFSGLYKERRYCPILDDYRDIIILNDTEKEFSESLEKVLSELLKFYQNKINFWIGISKENSKQLWIWTEIEELAFEHYWFQVKTVNFRENEIIIKLKALRTIDSNSANTSNDSTYKNIDLYFVYLANILNAWLQKTKLTIIQFLQTTKLTIIQFLEQEFTKENVFAAIKLIFLLLFVALVFSIKALKLFCIYGLRLLIEMRLLLKTSTPLLLNVLNLMNKMIGGFYLLLAMIWKDIVGTRLNPPQRRFIQPIVYNNNNYNRNRFR